MDELGPSASFDLLGPSAPLAQENTEEEVQAVETAQTEPSSSSEKPEHPSPAAAATQPVRHNLSHVK